MTQELREKKLRQEIHALRVKKFHWSETDFRFIISGLGYGESLCALSEDKLTELKALLLRYRRHGRPQAFTFDKQGKYMFALMKQANKTDSDIRAFMLQHFHISHWNLLNQPERRAVIAMLQNYISKQANNQNNTTQKEQPITDIEKENSNGKHQNPQTEKGN